MPTPSLAEEVLKATTIIFELLPKMVTADAKSRVELVQVLTKACTNLERVALRRMMDSDAEATRRAARELVKDLQAFIPAARG